METQQIQFNFVENRSFYRNTEKEEVNKKDQIIEIDLVVKAKVNEAAALEDTDGNVIIRH